MNSSFWHLVCALYVDKLKSGEVSEVTVSICLSVVACSQWLATLFLDVRLLQVELLVLILPPFGFNQIKRSHISSVNPEIVTIETSMSWVWILIQTTSVETWSPLLPPPPEGAAGPFCHLFWVEKVLHYPGGGVNGQEVIWSKLPPDATPISPESNTQPRPLSLPFRARPVFTSAIYPHFLLIPLGLHHSLRAALNSSLYPGVLWAQIYIYKYRLLRSFWGWGVWVYSTIAAGNMEYHSLHWNDTPPLSCPWRVNISMPRLLFTLARRGI